MGNAYFMSLGLFLGLCRGACGELYVESVCSNCGIEKEILNGFSEIRDGKS